jgi:flavin-dependent dehydrogenase
MAGAAGDLDGFYRDSLRRRWSQLAERLATARLEGPARAIGPLALQSRAVAAPGVVLLGDAAGFYDPFTGEGITLALRSAELAAEALEQAFSAPSGAASLPRLRGYERSRDEATRDKFLFNRLLQLVVDRPLLANAAARRLARRSDLADHLVGIAGDFVPARTALGTRFLIDLIRA